MKPYYVPFTEAENSSLRELWNNENVAGTYAASSLRSNSPLLKLAEVEKAGHDSKWTINDKHWELARHHLCNNAQIPVESLAAYLFRDYAIMTQEPSAFSLVETFNEEFGYEIGGRAFSHLYRTGDSEISEESFVKYD